MKFTFRRKATKERRTFVSIANIATLLGILLAVGGAWAERVADATDVKRRVTTIEERALEDRGRTNEARKQLQKEVKETNDNVQKILIKLETMDAVQKAERERRTR